MLRVTFTKLRLLKNLMTALSLCVANPQSSFEAVGFFLLVSLAFLQRYSGLCSSRARWPLGPNFYPQATRKSQIFHTNHMLGTLDFTVSEHWAPFNFL